MWTFTQLRGLGRIVASCFVELLFRSGEDEPVFARAFVTTGDADCSVVDAQTAIQFNRSALPVGRADSEVDSLSLVVVVKKPQQVQDRGV